MARGSEGVGAAGAQVGQELEISALATANAVKLARVAEEVGCAALMVLPPCIYRSDWREMKRHVAEVIAATKLPCMLYNNPAAYKTTFFRSRWRSLPSSTAV